MFRPSMLSLALLMSLWGGTANAEYIFKWPLTTVPLQGASAPAAEATPLTVTLAAASPPAGEVSQFYSYDLKQLLSVTGDPAYSPTSVTWRLPSGSLPVGLTLGNDGVISGTPTVQNTAGATFQVVAEYQTAEGQQAYTIVVNGVTLHVTQMAGGYQHTCAITTAGGLKCWGSDQFGQLGNDSTMADQAAPADVFGMTSGVARVAAGAYHTCASTTAGELKCWGLDNAGQLGDNVTQANKATPVTVQGLTAGVTQFALGLNNTCAIVYGELRCWGLTHSTTASSNVPSVVAGISGAVSQVAIGQQHTCAVMGGGVKCWGPGTNGQLGHGVFASSLTPVDVIGLANVSQLVAAAASTCARTSAGAALCWGDDGSGTLGDDTAMTSKAAPVPVAGLSSGVSQLSAGMTHVCAVTTGGRLKCWGSDYYGELGNDATLTHQPTPVDVPGLTSGVTSVAAGSSHTCAVVSGSAKCWGFNNKRQLGDKTTTNQPTPVAVQP